LRCIGHGRGLPIERVQRRTLARIQGAKPWSGVERRNAFRPGVGRESLTLRVSGEQGSPGWQCNGPHRCRASNPRRVGRGRRNWAGFLVVGAGRRESPLLGWDATGGRSASLAKRVVSQHTACPLPFPAICTVRHSNNRSCRSYPVYRIRQHYFSCDSLPHSPLQKGTSCHARGRALSRSLRVFPQGNCEIRTGIVLTVRHSVARLHALSTTTYEDQHETAQHTEHA
jgi:hypothetical protein